MNKDESKKIYGRNLKRLRQERGMSQEELAKALGFKNRSSINKIEIGRSNIPTDLITRTAEILGVSPLELFQEESEVQETMSIGSFRGGVDITAQTDKISPVLEKLSPNNQEKLLDYALFLLQQQDKGDES